MRVDFAPEMLTVRFLLGVVAACLPPMHGLLAADAPEMTVSQYGTYAAGIVSLVPDPQSPNAARARIGDYVFLEATYDICARIGVNFGFELRRGAHAPGAKLHLDVAIQHPPVHGVDGRIHLREHYEYDVMDQPLLLGWMYRHSNTLVAGEWSWTVTDGRGALVTRQSFHVETDCPVPMA